MRKSLQSFIFFIIGFVIHYNKAWSWLIVLILIATEFMFWATTSEPAPSPKEVLSYKETKELLDGYYSSIPQAAPKNKGQWQLLAYENLLPPGVPKDPEAYFKAKGEWISWEDFLTRKKV